MHGQVVTRTRLSCFSSFYFSRISAILLALVSLCISAVSFAGDYNRREWLPRWSDFDRDCQDTRHELLIRYSLAPVVYTSRDDCRVAFGLWMDPYTGEFFEKASDLDVEHIVPLKWAHDHGAADWSREKKRQFAEDLENLWLVDDGRNQSKGHRGPDQWMPPYGPVRRFYIQRFIAIAEKYGLKASQQESQIFLALLENRHG